LFELLEGSFTASSFFNVTIHLLPPRFLSPLPLKFVRFSNQAFRFSFWATEADVGLGVIISGELSCVILQYVIDLFGRKLAGVL